MKNWKYFSKSQSIWIHVRIRAGTLHSASSVTPQYSLGNRWFDIFRRHRLFAHKPGSQILLQPALLNCLRCSLGNTSQQFFVQVNGVSSWTMLVNKPQGSLERLLSLLWRMGPVGCVQWSPSPPHLWWIPWASWMYLGIQLTSCVHLVTHLAWIRDKRIYRLERHRNLSVLLQFHLSRRLKMQINDFGLYDFKKLCLQWHISVLYTLRQPKRGFSANNDSHHYWRY